MLSSNGRLISRGDLVKIASNGRFGIVQAIRARHVTVILGDSITGDFRPTDLTSIGDGLTNNFSYYMQGYGEVEDAIARTRDYVSRLGEVHGVVPRAGGDLQCDNGVDSRP